MFELIRDFDSFHHHFTQVRPRGRHERKGPRCVLLR